MEEGAIKARKLMEEYEISTRMFIHRERVNIDLYQLSYGLDLCRIEERIPNHTFDIRLSIDELLLL